MYKFSRCIYYLLFIKYKVKFLIYLIKNKFKGKDIYISNIN